MASLILIHIYEEVQRPPFPPPFTISILQLHVLAFWHQCSSQFNLQEEVLGMAEEMTSPNSSF